MNKLFLILLLETLCFGVENSFKKYHHKIGVNGACRVPEWGGSLDEDIHLFEDCVYTAANATMQLDVSNASKVILNTHRFTDIHSRIIYAASRYVSLYLTSCVFEEIGPNDANGGCILLSFTDPNSANMPTCEVTACTFRGCISLSGGAIYLDHYLPAISSSIFHSCTALRHGGAVALHLPASSQEVTSENSYVRNCSFAGNSANDFGGSVVMENPYRTAFADNRFCGGVSNTDKGSDLYISGGVDVLVGNYASSCSNSGRCRVYSGGDACSTLIMLTECATGNNQNGCNVCASCAPNSGGWCRHYCHFDEVDPCRPYGWGGWLSGGQYSYDDCIYTAANATTQLVATQAISLTIRMHRFTAIHSRVVFATYSSVLVTLVGCTFEDVDTNMFDNGGCISLEYELTTDMPVCNITSCTFRGCTSRVGGAVLLAFYLPTISSCIFQACSSTYGSGGAVSLEFPFSSAEVTPSSSSIYNCSFAANRASDYGAAVYVIYPLSMSITNSRICGGVAYSGLGTDLYITGEINSTEDYTSLCSNSAGCRVFADGTGDVGGCSTIVVLPDCSTADNQNACNICADCTPDSRGWCRHNCYDEPDACREVWGGWLSTGRYSYTDCVYTSANATTQLNINSADSLTLHRHRFTGIRSRIIFASSTLTSVTVTESVFEDITTSGNDGGCISLSSFTTINTPVCTITACTFRRCSGNLGAALFLRTFLPAITSSVFSACSASVWGGAIFLSLKEMASGTAHINNCSFIANRASLYGGSVVLENPTNTSFARNRICGGVSDANFGSDIYITGTADPATGDYASSCSDSAGCSIYYTRDGVDTACSTVAPLTRCAAVEDNQGVCDAACADCASNSEGWCLHNKCDELEPEEESEPEDGQQEQPGSPDNSNNNKKARNVGIAVGSTVGGVIVVVVVVVLIVVILRYSKQKKSASETEISDRTMLDEVDDVSSKKKTKEGPRSVWDSSVSGKDKRSLYDGEEEAGRMMEDEEKDRV